MPLIDPKTPQSTSEHAKTAQLDPGTSTFQVIHSETWENMGIFPIGIFSYEICDFLLICKKSILDRGIFTP